MKFTPGDVVVLKSGGQPMTVISADDSSVECLWLGEEGDLFREKIPPVALLAIDMDDDGEESDEDDDEAGDKEEEEAAPVKNRSRKKLA
jgi:uncharacterized protein YodC (DUF2158 family)